MPLKHFIIVYDGYCGLCSRVVRFVKSRDKYRLFTFMPQTTSPSKDEQKGEQETIAFWEGDRLLEGSTAALRILFWLGWPWKALYVFIVIPRTWRDAVYRFIARRRYRWFGRHDQCFLRYSSLDT